MKMPADATTDQEGGASPSPTERTGCAIFSSDLTEKAEEAEETEDSGSRVLAKGIYSGDKIGRVLDEADGGDAGGAG
jgi:hypothetical protein